MTATEDERLARAALSRIAEPGDRVMVELVARLGAVETYAAIRDGTLPSDRLPHYRTRGGRVDPGSDLEQAARQGIRLVCPGDLEWPSQLNDLDERRPLALWVRGSPDLRLWMLRSISVVGARAATDYGEHVAAELASVVAERGWTIVSGAAFGVDAAAHRGALAVGGQTVAVLACGVDVAYPLSHASLIDRIANEGVLVSELAPGCTVTKPRFLERNRVIAALTRGTVVVEAAYRSGALRTAHDAVSLNRHLMAVPGPVTSMQSAGCHRLVRTAGAGLVTDGAEVLDLVGEVGEHLAPEVRGPQRPHDGLDSECLRVLEALSGRRFLEVDTLTGAAGLDVPTVMRCLSELAELGLAESAGAGWRLAARRPGGA